MDGFVFMDMSRLMSCAELREAPDKRRDSLIFLRTLSVSIRKLPTQYCVVKTLSLWCASSNSTNSDADPSLPSILNWEHLYLGQSLHPLLRPHDADKDQTATSRSWLRKKNSLMFRHEVGGYAADFKASAAAAAIWRRKKQ